jgi:hypothetical protein
MVLSEMNPILLELWREKHPQGLEQFVLNFETCTESGRSLTSHMSGVVLDRHSLILSRAKLSRCSKSKPDQQRFSTLLCGTVVYDTNMCHEESF